MKRALRALARGTRLRARAAPTRRGTYQGQYTSAIRTTPYIVLRPGDRMVSSGAAMQLCHRGVGDSVCCPRDGGGDRWGHAAGWTGLT